MPNPLSHSDVLRGHPLAGIMEGRPTYRDLRALDAIRFSLDETGDNTAPLRLALAHCGRLNATTP